MDPVKAAAELSGLTPETLRAWERRHAAVVPHRDGKGRRLYDAAMIERLVRRFYEKIRADDLLGPVFASRIDAWEPHLQRMFAFWSSVTLMTGRYSGNPMQKHISLPIDADHFDRWLEIFAETAAEVCPPAAARLFVEKASRIAQSLELGIAQRHCQLINREERFYRPKPPV